MGLGEASASHITKLAVPTNAAQSAQLIQINADWNQYVSKRNEKTVGGSR